MAKRLGDFLIEKKFISLEQLEKILKYQRELKRQGRSKRLGELLVELGLVNEERVLEALSEQWGYPVIDLSTQPIDYNLLTRYSIQFLKKNRLVPFHRNEKGIWVATPDPFNFNAIAQMERESGGKIKLFLANQRGIDEVLNKGEVLKKTGEIVTRIKKGGSNGINLIEQLVDLILTEAIREKGSDIHIEPNDRYLSIRIRVDGVLREAFHFDLEIFPALDSKLKLLAGLNITEKRIPQDGRFTRQVDGRNYDFRVSTTPTIFGESIVLRVLDSNKALLPLEKLGISAYNLKRLKRAIQAPYGLILVTGPTGSGKTTTLYSILHQLKGIEKKIITVEDPVEYRIPEIQQIQVNPQVGRTFQIVLRSLLRQDPDIIMVGEIRDRETLTIAIEAGLTGHLVLATLHTNSAIGAVSRMIEMGGERALLAETLVAVIGQRLVRRLCSKCKREQLPALEQLELVKPFLKGRKFRFYGAKGCPVCKFTGYSGRESVTEILLNSKKISHSIQQDADSLQLEQIAEEEGFRSMLVDGLEKVELGITSLTELLRVVKISY